MQPKSVGKRLLPEQPLLRLLIVWGMLFLSAGLFNAVGLHGISGALLCLFAMVFYYAAALAPLFGRECRRFLKRELAGSVWQSAIILALLSAAAFYLISGERYVYFWDYSLYWQRCIVVEEGVFANPFSMLLQCLKSINFTEYNLLLPLVLALPFKLFGTGHASYIMLPFVMFVLPAVFMLALSAARVIKGFGKENVPFWCVLLLTALIPSISAPCLHGYLDAGALLPCASLMLMMTGWSWERFSPADCSAVYVMLLLAVLGRRYFAFFVIGFVAGWAVHAVLSIVLCGGAKRKKLIESFLCTYTCVGGICALVLMFFFSGFAKMSFGRDYAEIYKGWATSGFWEGLLRGFSRFGWLLLLGAAVGLALNVRRVIKKKQSVSAPAYPVFLLFGALVSAAAFLRVQSMGAQHIYILVAPMTVFIVSGLALLAAALDKKTFFVGALALCCCVSAVGFARSVSLVSFARPPLFPSESYSPKIREDIPVLEQMSDRIKELTAADGSSVYFLASSDILNDNIMIRLYYPKDNALPVMGYAHSDLRDGFSTELLKAKYVVVCDPVQLHLAAGTQKVIEIPANEILGGTGIGANYEYMQEWTLDRGVKAKLYRLAKDFSQQDIRELAARFDAVYPDYPQLFKNRILSMIE